MRQSGRLFAGVLVAAASCAAAASAHPAAVHRAGSATVELRETNRGKILVDSAGFTLYVFTLDKKKKDACQKIEHCTEVWPPLKVTGTPTAGPGLKASKLGTIALEGGGSQVTYYGHALFLYSGDFSPELTGYIGVNEFGGAWYGETAKGKSVL